MLKYLGKTKRLALIGSIAVLLPQAYAQPNLNDLDDEAVLSSEEVLPANPLNPAVGQTVYKKTKVKHLKAQSAFKDSAEVHPKASKSSDSQMAYVAPDSVQSNSTSEIELKNKALPNTKPATSTATLAEATAPNVKQTTPLVVKPENITGKEEELLKRIKAEKQAKSTDKTIHKKLAENNLNVMPNTQVNAENPERDAERYKLAPGETVIKSNREKSKSANQLANSKSVDDVYIDKLEFNQANMLDVSRALADISGLNFVATEEASKKNVTVFLQNISVKNALEAITKNAGLWYRRDKDSGTFRIMSTEEYQRDLVVYREDITKVFNLFHPNPVLVATAIKDLYGDRVVLSFGSDFDDFNTGGFNGINNGGGQNANGNNRNNNRNGGGSAGGASLSNGQNSLRRPITTGTASGNNALRNNNNQTNRFDEKISGTSGNGAITEKLTADQLSKLEQAIELDENGNPIATDAIRGITRSQQPIYVTISRQQNMMILRTSDAVAVKEIENLVKAMDKPTTQVLLEMKILEVDVGDDYKQLFSFGALSKNGKNRVFGLEDDDNADSGKFIYQFVDDLISVKLELLERNKKARTVSSPVLLASNNRTARLFVGEERLLIRGATLTDPVLGVNGQVTTPGRITYETEIRNIGDTLNITPKINADGTVTLGIFQDTSTVNIGAVDFPPLVSTNGAIFNFSIDTVLTANIEGVVVAKDGLTVAIGGLIRTATSKEESKIPVLGDLPVIGNVFKDKVEVASRKELILLITPHIITSPSESDDISRDAVEPISTQEW